MISSFQRNLIKVELKKRLDSWRSPSFRSQYLGNLSVKSDSSVYTIERDESGHYFISDNLVGYSNLRNGMIFRIRKTWNPTDWDCYTALYNKGVETGKFRIDIPLFREILNFGTEEWEYAELQSPGSNYGTNFNDDVFSWPELTDGITPSRAITEELRDSVKNYFKEFVDQAFEITKEAGVIAEARFTGMPLDLCYIFNRYKDDAGYFWSDFDQASWDNSKEKVIEDSLNKLLSALQFAGLCGVLDADKVEEIMTYARTKWTAI